MAYEEDEDFFMLNIADTRNSTKALIYEKLWIYFLTLDIVLVIPTVFGNALLIASVIVFRRLRRSTTYVLVANLALSDILVGLIILPMDITVIVSEWASRHLQFCLWHHCLSGTFMGASVMNLLLMSVDRFSAIRDPLKHRIRFSRKRVLVLISLSWIFISIISFIPLFGWRVNHQENAFICRIDDFETKMYRITSHTIIVISLIINFILFVIVVKLTVRNAKKPISGPIRRFSKDSFRHTQVMLLVSGVFAFCWAPYCVVSLTYMHSDNLLYTNCILASFGLLNSGLNWVIYGLLNVKFRKAFRKLLKCRYSDSEPRLRNDTLSTIL